jgi:branched-chain amino acid transport system substrate-binding protein
MRYLASRWRASLIVAAAVIALASSVSAVAGPDQHAATLNLKIGALVPDTGTSSAYGPATEKAVDMAAAVANQAAKAAKIGISVTVESVDNQSDPVATVSAARKLATDGATCIVGASSSATTIAAAQSVAIPLGITLIAPSSTSSAVTPLHDQGGLTFRTVAADPLEASGLATAVKQRLHGAKGKVVSVAGRNDAYGQGLTSAFAAAWKALGGQVQGPLLYDPNALTYDSEAQKIVDGNPDQFVIIDLPNTYGKVATALLRTGKWSTTKTWIAGGYPATIPSGIPPETLNLVSGISPGFPRSGPLVAAFNKLWASSSGTKQQQSYAQNAFDAGLLCVLGAVKAKSTNGRAIAKQLNSVSGPNGSEYTFQTFGDALKAVNGGKAINYQGVSGPVDFDAHGDIKTSFLNVYKYIDGKLVVLGVMQPKGASPPKK